MSRFKVPDSVRLMYTDTYDLNLTFLVRKGGFSRIAAS
jgi:hypothetical protein